MIKQIKDLSTATIDDLNDNCQFVMDDSNDKTKRVSFNVLKQKITSGITTGVSKIIAGDNVTIEPSTGIGDVKIGCQVGGGTIKVPILTPLWFDHVVLNDSAWIQSDGLWKDKSDAKLIYDHLVEDWNDFNSVEETETINDITITFKRAVDGHKIVTVVNDNLDTLFEATGVAWYYVLDTANEKFRLPRTKYGFQGIKNGKSVGTYDAPGLPNITGYISGLKCGEAGEHSHKYENATLTTYTGAGSGNYTQPKTIGQGTTLADGKHSHNISGNISISNDKIYGTSNTVQPPATEMLLYFSTGVGGSGDIIDTGSGSCVPKYAAYDPQKHDVQLEDVTTFGNNNIPDYGYLAIAPKSAFGTKIFKASEDCYFFPYTYSYAIRTGEPIVYSVAVFVGENDQCENLFRVFSADVSLGDFMTTWMVPLKKGQILAIWNGGEDYYSETTDKCFWLPMQSLAPQIAMPDYKATPVDVKAAVDASTDKKWIATENGWLNIRTQYPSNTIVYIDGVEVAMSTHNPDHWTSNESNVVPISSGDVVTYSSTNTGVGIIKFYPCKSVPQKSDKEEILSLIYPVGSIYLDGSNGEVCPLTSVITGSEWQKIGTKLLTDGSTAPVVGNGSSLGLTSATGTPSVDNMVLERQNNTGILFGSTNSSHPIYGVNTDPEKSGLVANLGDATGITVAIWKRIS